MARRGEIYYVDWSPGRGSEQAGVRPSLVVQNDAGNRASSTTIVAAITSRTGRPYPFHVQISPAESGLPRESTILCEQLLTVTTDRLGRYVGMLIPDRMRDVDLALLYSLGLPT
jgi:mRNA interferase MazF